MKIKRRDFLVFAAGLITSAALAPKIRTKTKTSTNNLLLGGGQFFDDHGKKQYVISQQQLKPHKLFITMVDFFPHGFTANPINKKHIAVFEKHGVGATLYDSENQRVLKKIPAVSGRHFYGHGTYSRDGQLLFSTETELHSRKGLIGIRDAKTLQYLGEFPSYGQEPHDCQLVGDGSTLAITNSGGDLTGENPSFTLVDIKTQKLIDRHYVENPRFNAGHFATTSTGASFVCSAPRKGIGKQELGGVNFLPSGGKLTSIQEPQKLIKRLSGEALSIVVEENNGIAAVTHPAANLITFWSTKTGSLIKSLDIASPRGIALSSDNKTFIVSHGSQAELSMIDVKSFSLEKIPGLVSSYITSSHLYNHFHL